MSCRRDNRTYRIKHQQKGSQELEAKQRQRIKVEGNKYAGDKLSGHHSSTDPSACGRSDSTSGHRSNVSASGKVRYCNLPATRTNYMTTSSFCRHTHDWFDTLENIWHNTSTLSLVPFSIYLQLFSFCCFCSSAIWSRFTHRNYSLHLPFTLLQIFHSFLFFRAFSLFCYHFLIEFNSLLERTKNYEH